MVKKKLNTSKNKSIDSSKKEMIDQLKKENELLKKENELLKKENKKLKDKLNELEEIVKNTQLQYISLKNEFDVYQRRIDSQQKQMKQQIFENIILDILPILELFMQSYEHLPSEFKDHKWVEGLNIINKKIHNFLDSKGIEIIPTVGEEPNEDIHEILHIQEVSDKEKKGKIIQEIKKGYIIKTSNGKKVLLPAKVVLGS